MQRIKSKGVVSEKRKAWESSLFLGPEDRPALKGLSTKHPSLRAGPARDEEGRGDCGPIPDHSRMERVDPWAHGQVQSETIRLRRLGILSGKWTGGSL